MYLKYFTFSGGQLGFYHSLGLSRFLIHLDIGTLLAPSFFGCFLYSHPRLSLLV